MLNMPVLALLVAAIVGVLVYLAGLSLLWSVVIGLLVLVLLFGVTWGWNRD